MLSSMNLTITLNHKPAVYTVLLRLQVLRIHQLWSVLFMAVQLFMAVHLFLQALH